MTTPIRIDHLAEMSPLDGAVPDLREALPEAVSAAVLDGPGRLYAVLDAGRVMFLADRLEALGLDHRMIYRSPGQMDVADDDRNLDDAMADVSPYLVALPDDSALIADFFRVGEERPWHLMDKRAGVLIRSPLEMAPLLAHLRQFSFLPDELGVETFFRFQEPAMWAALATALPEREAAFAMRGAEAVVWVQDSLHDGLWDVFALRPEPALQALDPAVPVVGRLQRKALRDAVNARRARRIVREKGYLPGERAVVARDLARLLGLSQSSADAMLHTVRLFRAAPVEEHAYWWSLIEAGHQSLGVINRQMHERYGVGEFAK